MTRYAWCALLMFSPCIGCGRSVGDSTRPPSTEALAAMRSADVPLAGEDAKIGVVSQVSAATPVGANRKIIHSAQVDLVVENFNDVPARVAALVKQFDAYVADSNLAGASGTSRQATWKIRVPIARFEEFLSATKGLGELVSASTQSQDVSEEYYDVDARIRNKTREEERLLKLLEDRPGKLEDVVAIERELSRVREELERMQGRLRVLADLTAMTTVRLSISEVRKYEPVEAATFATRVRRAFQSSILGMKATGEDSVVAAAAVAPWLSIVGLCIVPVYGVLRHRRNRVPRAEPPTVTA